MRIATIGAAFSGNKGAAAMLHAVVDRVHDRAPAARIDVHSTYAASDGMLAPSNVRIVDSPPWRLPLVDFPLALVAGAARCVGLPQRPFLRTAALRSLAAADVVVDLAGISFVDSRKVYFTVYNAMADSVPILLGTPLVKAAQAMGPFDRPINRTLARLVLRRLSSIQARGDRSTALLNALGLENVQRSADIAFTLNEGTAVSEDVEAVLPDVGDAPLVTVMPSAVVNSRCDELGIDYLGALVALVKHLVASGAIVLIAPHSFRGNGKPKRMHDGAIVDELAKRVGPHRQVEVANGDFTPMQLRSFVRESSLLVTSRFHAMISGLATATPTVVVGWSHKYAEVLADFGLERFALPYERVRDPQCLIDSVEDVWRERAAISRQIADALPAVKHLAERNYRAIGQVVGVELSSANFDEVAV